MIYRRIQSLSQRPGPATPACGDKYPYWLVAAFGNLFMANFYCAPKEIRALCILGKKNTSFKHSFFRGRVCVLCELYLVARNSVAFCAAAAPVSGCRLRVCVGNSCPWPKPTGPAREQPGQPEHTPSFSCLDEDLCSWDDSTQPSKEKRKQLSLHPWLGNSTRSS